MVVCFQYIVYGPIGADTPLVQKPVAMEHNLDQDLKKEKNIMVVLVLAQVQWQEIATLMSVQVSTVKLRTGARLC